MVCCCCLVRFFGQIHPSSGLPGVIASGRFYGLPERPVQVDGQLESWDGRHLPRHNLTPDEGLSLAILASWPPRDRRRGFTYAAGRLDAPVRVADAGETESGEKDLKSNIVVGRNAIPRIDQVSPC